LCVYSTLFLTVHTKPILLPTFGTHSLAKSKNSVCETLKASQQRYASQMGCSSLGGLYSWLSQENALL